jgi:hypothetical protein
MDAVLAFIGILLSSITIFAGKMLIFPKKTLVFKRESQPKPAQIQNKPQEKGEQPFDLVADAAKITTRPKNYLELMQTISKGKKETLKTNLQNARIAGVHTGKPKEYTETVNKEHIEADNVFAIDEWGDPTERNVANDKIDIPAMLGQLDKWVALAQIAAAFIILLIFLQGG